MHIELDLPCWMTYLSFEQLLCVLFDTFAWTLRLLKPYSICISISSFLGARI